MSHFDPHSGYEPGMPKMLHLGLSIDVDFVAKLLRARAWITFDRASKPTVLDTRDLQIQKLTDLSDREIIYTMSDTHPVRGTTMSFKVPPEGVVIVHYVTSANASGLMWMDASQTLGKQFPCMFTQGQSLQGTSYVPCQNSPSIRFPFDATVTVPQGLRVLMGGESVSRVHQDDGTALERWKMRQQIPAYLLTLAVGDFRQRTITSRCYVYGEKEIIEAAVYEFAQFGEMLERVEAQFGPYVWDRFDMLVMPPSFPYGGMENPRLTFLSPTVLAGDRSSISVLAHELAHSWTGNLVGNARWCDFWLNEGWTTYLEWRIIEMLYGHEQMFLTIYVGMQELQRSFESLAERGLSKYTALSSPIPVDVDPDDILTQVPYVKGALFIGMLEHAVGRERFDVFIREYIATFSFRSLTTEDFLEFLDEKLPGVSEQVKARDWVYGQGLRDNAPLIVSPLAREVEEMVVSGIPCASDDECVWIERARLWSEKQWHLALELMKTKDTVSVSDMAWFDQNFHLSYRKNFDVRAAFLTLAAEKSFDRWADEITNMLMTVGNSNTSSRFTKLLHNPP